MPELSALIGPGLLYGLAALACPVGMGAMMWFMMRGGRAGQPMGQPQTPAGSGPEPGKEAELARLRAEIDQLKAAQADQDASPAT